MSWENALDRLVIAQVHKAEKKEVRNAEIKRLLGDLFGLETDRPEFSFHAGYAQALLGLELPELSSTRKEDQAARRWYLFGQMKAHDRKGEREWVGALVEDRQALFDLLHEPGIAWGLLPVLMRAFIFEEKLDNALSAVEYLALTFKESVEREHTVELVKAGLTDLLAIVERRKVEPENGPGSREIIRRCRAVDGFNELPAEVQARFELVDGRAHRDTCDWDQAEVLFQGAIERAEVGSRLESRALVQLAWARMRICSELDLSPVPERENRVEIVDLVESACKARDKAVPEAFFTRGLLTFETLDYAKAQDDFDHALVLLRRNARPAEELVAKMRFFLASAILGGDNREEAIKAARLIDQALDFIKPDINTFYTVYEPLKAINRETALKLLDAVDLERGTSADVLLIIAMEYINLGEADRATAAIERVLQFSTDIDQRIEASKARLLAASMQGTSGDAREALDVLRGLLSRRGRFEDLEAVLLDENLVGHALDHIEVKCELIDLYEEMEGREDDRGKLQLAVARTLRARKERETLEDSLSILKDLELTCPDLAADEIDAVEKLLARDDGGGDEGGSPEACVRELGQALGHKPNFLVIGGNERQRKHVTRLEELMKDWGFTGQWEMANYTSPERPVALVERELSQKRVDGLILLHWNRHETTEPALALARRFDCPARVVYYAGFTSLHNAIGQMLKKMVMAANDPAGEEGQKGRKGAGAKSAKKGKKGKKKVGTG